MIKSRMEITFEWFLALILLGVTIITLYPVLYVVFASVSDAFLLMRNRGLLLRPLGFQIEAYRMVLNNPDIARGYRNTLVILTLGTAISMTLTILAAYAISKTTMFMRYLTFFIVFTMWFSAGMIPFFLVVGMYLGLRNSIWALILPGALSTFNLLVLRTGFKGVPDSLEESARMDGAHDFTILFRIFLPLCKANIAVIMLFYMVGFWNAWFNAMLFLTTRDLFPLQLILREILILNNMHAIMAAGGVALQDQIGIAENIRFATVVIATVPILMVYPFLQKYFVKGVMIGAIKG